MLDFQTSGLHSGELRGIARLLSVFREFDPKNKMVMQTAHVFIAITLKQGCSISYVMDACGLSQSAASRNVLTLSDGSDGSKGLGLVSGHLDPDDSRRKLIYLTQLGFGVAKRLVATSLNIPESEVTLRHWKPSTARATPRSRP